MKKRLLLFMGFCLLVNSYYAQTTSEILQWQSSHPDILLMSKSNFDALSKTTQSKISSKVVFLENLSSIVLDQKNTQSEIALYVDDQSIIKNWLSTNPDVKIIPRSIYDTLSEEKREMYLSIASLILEGEVITVKDIENYPH